MDLLELLSILDILESLLSLLSPSDVLRAASCSSQARSLLGSEFVWRILSRQTGGGQARPGFLMREYGEYQDRVNRLGLQPLCRTSYQMLYPRHLRYRWRSAARDVLYMPVEETLIRDQLVSYDVCLEFLALGTLLGKIVIWRLDSRTPQVLDGSLEQRVDKVTIRHSKIIVLQNGLLSVYCQDGRMFRLMYRRSFESPDPGLLGEAGWVPDLETVEFRRRYKARDPARFPAQLVTVSTTGEEFFCSARMGREEVSLHHLETGEVRETVSVELRVEHLAIVHFRDHSHLLYLLLRSDTTGLLGRFYDIQARRTHSELQLSEEFDMAGGFYSLFSEHGLLMMGQAPHSDSQSFKFCCWNYEGHLVYRHQDWAEFGLCLADCGPSALTTPRSLNLLHTTSQFITLSQRNHRGAAVICLAWHPGLEASHQVWKVSSSLSVQSPRPGCLVTGSEAGGVVCTVSGGAALTVREETNGRVLWEEQVDTVIQNVWLDDTVMVVVPPDFRHGSSVCCIKIR